MQLKSLGRQTDLVFSEIEGKIVKKDHYWLVQSPKNPSFFWGNYIIFETPPKPEDFDNWCQIFREEFSYYDEIKHMVFAWDLSEQKLDIKNFQKFTDFGFELDPGIVLSTDRTNLPPKVNTKITVKPITSDLEWKNLAKCRVKSRDLKYFNTKQNAMNFWMLQEKKYRYMSENNMGRWYGAYIGDEIVANLGIFQKEGLARFQQVETDPDHRRLGICGTLVHTTSQLFAKEFKVNQFVMEADEAIMLPRYMNP